MDPREVGLVYKGRQVLFVCVHNESDQLLWHVDFISAHVLLQFLCAHDVHYLHQLVVIV